MMKSLCHFALLLLLWPTAVYAQSNQADPFCAISGVELLAALDGSWTLTQGAGFAAAGAMLIPLPPHRGKTVNLTYDPELTGTTMRAEGQQMLLLPTPPGMVRSAMRYLQEAEAENLLSIGDGCDFYELPIVLGSTTYQLQDGTSTVPGYALGVSFGGEAEIICVRQASYDSIVGEPSLSKPGGLLGSTQILHEDDDSAVVLVGGDDQICANMAVGVSDPGEGEMVMSLAVKFQSENYGTGMLYFEGFKNGQHFGAKAPIFLSR